MNLAPKLLAEALLQSGSTKLALAEPQESSGAGEDSVSMADKVRMMLPRIESDKMAPAPLGEDDGRKALARAAIHGTRTPKTAAQALIAPAQEKRAFFSLPLEALLGGAYGATTSAHPLSGALGGAAGAGLGGLAGGLGGAALGGPMGMVPGIGAGMGLGGLMGNLAGAGMGAAAGRDYMDTEKTQAMAAAIQDLRAALQNQQQAQQKSAAAQGFATSVKPTEVKQPKLSKPSTRSYADAGAALAAQAASKDKPGGETLSMEDAQKLTQQVKRASADVTGLAGALMGKQAVDPSTVSPSQPGPPVGSPEHFFQALLRSQHRSPGPDSIEGAQHRSNLLRASLFPHLPGQFTAEVPERRDGSVTTGLITSPMGKLLSGNLNAAQTALQEAAHPPKPAPEKKPEKEKKGSAAKLASDFLGLGMAGPMSPLGPQPGLMPGYGHGEPEPPMAESALEDDASLGLLGMDLKGLADSPEAIDACIAELEALRALQVAQQARATAQTMPEVEAEMPKKADSLRGGPTADWIMGAYDERDAQRLRNEELNASLALAAQRSSQQSAMNQAAQRASQVAQQLMGQVGGNVGGGPLGVAAGQLGEVAGATVGDLPNQSVQKPKAQGDRAQKPSNDKPKPKEKVGEQLLGKQPNVLAKAYEKVHKSQPAPKPGHGHGSCGSEKAAGPLDYLQSLLGKPTETTTIETSSSVPQSSSTTRTFTPHMSAEALDNMFGMRVRNRIDGGPWKEEIQPAPAWMHKLREALGGVETTTTIGGSSSLPTVPDPKTQTPPKPTGEPQEKKGSEKQAGPADLNKYVLPAALGAMYGGFTADDDKVMESLLGGALGGVMGRGLGQAGGAVLGGLGGGGAMRALTGPLGYLPGAGLLIGGAGLAGAVPGAILGGWGGTGLGAHIGSSLGERIGKDRNMEAEAAGLGKDASQRPSKMTLEELEKQANTWANRAMAGAAGLAGAGALAAGAPAAGALGGLTGLYTLVRGMPKGPVSQAIGEAAPAAAEAIGQSATGVSPLWKYLAIPAMGYGAYKYLQDSGPQAQPKAPQVTFQMPQYGNA